MKSSEAAAYLVAAKRDNELLWMTMGEHDIELEPDEYKDQVFLNGLLEDLRALYYMLDDLIESTVYRIGAPAPQPD